MKLSAFTSVGSGGRSAALGQGGFSLVEMLAALVILGLALGALYQAASGATRNARVSAEYAIATTLAESELDAFLISRPDAGVTQRGRYGDYEWERWVELIPEREAAHLEPAHDRPTERGCPRCVVKRV
jgi:prepilin-type N-terminal cleavage/methylation domain-containing protein